MKDTLVVGVLNTGNLGDDLIYEMVFETCKRATHKEPLTLNIGNTKSKEDSEKIGKKKILLKKLKTKCSYLSFYKKYVEIKRLRTLNRMLNGFDFSMIDTIVFAGGQLLFDYFIPLIEVIVRRAESNSVKVILNACGVGPVSEENAKKLRYIVESPAVEMITLRESPQLLLSVIGPVKRTDIRRVNDPALQCASQYTFSSNDTKKVGIGLIDPIILRKHDLKISKSEYEAIIRKIVSYCDEKNLSYEFFCTGDKRDYTFICETQKIMYPDSVVADRPESVEALLQLISRYSSIISFRLHSHIIAASCSVPSFALVWDKKVEEFFKGTGREDDCFDLTKGEASDTIEQKLDRFFHEKYSCDLEKFENAGDALYEKLTIGKETQT